MADGPIVLGRRSLHWLHPYWRLDLLILAAILVEVSYWTLVPLALRLLIDGATEGRDDAYLARILALLGLGFLVSASVSTARMALTARLGARLLADARLRLFERLQRLPPRFFGRVHSGELVARFTTDLNAIESAFTFGLPEVVWGVVQLAIAVPLLYSLNVGMAIVATVSVPLAPAGPRRLGAPGSPRAGPGQRRPGTPAARSGAPASRARIRLLEPLDADPLPARLHPGMRLTIAFDDVSLPLPPMRPADIRGRVIEHILELAAAFGVDDVRLIAATSLHRRQSPTELREMLGERIFRSFWPDALGSHDAEAPCNLVCIGQTERGEVVEIDRRAAESELLIYVNINLAPMDGGDKSVAVGRLERADLSRGHAEPRRRPPAVPPRPSSARTRPAPPAGPHPRADRRRRRALRAAAAAPRGRARE